MDIILAGWLLKKKREDKTMLLGSKYQKRWFELTDDSLAYAKDPNELKETRIEVFSMLELKWFKRMGELKIEMQFPERVLRLKALSPGDANRWYKAIERLQVERAQNPTSTTSAGQDSYMAPAEPKKVQVATAFTIEAESDSDEDQHIPAGTVQSPQRGQASPKPQTLALPKGGLQMSHRRPPPPLPGPPISLLAPQEPEEPVQPPSPRSLLANPRLGGMMVSTPTKRQPSEEFGEPSGDEAEDEGGSCSPTRYSGRNSAQSLPATPPEAARPAYLNTSLRANVLIQDEMVGALRNPSSLGSSPSRETPPRESTPPGSNRRPPVAPTREEVITLEDRASPVTSRLGGCSAVSSRPGSGASVSSHATRGLHNSLNDERIELQAPAPRPTTASSRLNSAGSQTGASRQNPGLAVAAAPAQQQQVQSIHSSATPEAVVDETWMEDNWDSDADEDVGTPVQQHQKPKASTTGRAGDGSAGSPAGAQASSRAGGGKGQQQQVEISGGEAGDHTRVRHGLAGHIREASSTSQVTKPRAAVAEALTSARHQADSDGLHGVDGSRHAGHPVMEDVGKTLPKDADTNWVEDDWDEE